MLVHGTGGGGWQWRGVERLLRKAGHDVFTPTLTGCGERSHLLRDEEIGLDVHVLDVVRTLEYEAVRDVMLVGHSYGGNVITGVAHWVPERLSHLVYLDANVPRDGQSLTDLAYGTSADGRARFIERTRTRGAKWSQRRPEGRQLPAAQGVPADDTYAVYVERG